MNMAPSMDDVDLEHYLAYPEFMGSGPTDPALPAVATNSYVGRSTAILDLGNDVFVAYDRRAIKNITGPTSKTKYSPMWISEAASCLTTNAPMNKSMYKLLVDTGCGYDLVSKEQADSATRWIRKATTPKGVPNRERGYKSRPGGENDDTV